MGGNIGTYLGRRPRAWRYTPNYSKISFLRVSEYVGIDKNCQYVFGNGFIMTPCR